MPVKNYPKKMPIIYKSGNIKSLNINQESENLHDYSNVFCYNKKTGEVYKNNKSILDEFSKKSNISDKIPSPVTTSFIDDKKSNYNTISNKITNTRINTTKNTNITTNTNTIETKSNDLCNNKTKEELCEENYFILSQISELKKELENCKNKSTELPVIPKLTENSRSIYQIIPRSYDSALVVAKYAGLNPDNLIFDYFNSKPYAEITKREYFNNTNNNLNSYLDMFKFILLVFLLFLLFQLKKV